MTGIRVRNGRRLREIDLRWFFPVEQPAWRGGRLLVGLAILAILLGAFAAAGTFSADARPDSFGPALFFSVNIAYLVPVFGYISERTGAALEALAPTLQAEPNTVAAWRARIRRKPLPWVVVTVAIGVTSGILHNLLLAGSLTGVAEQVASSSGLAVALGTLLIWIVFTFVISALLDNAMVLARAARSVEVRPFVRGRVRPFATVAVISILALIGAQAAFPIMSIDGEFNPLAYLPGLLATSLSMLVLAALPVWPVHRRLVAVKRSILDELDRRISTLPLPDPAQPESLTQLTPLLAYRREVALLPEWPFDVGVLARLGLYLIIPPLTWVGAALIENVVDAFL